MSVWEEAVYRERTVTDSCLGEQVTRSKIGGRTQNEKG